MLVYFPRKEQFKISVRRLRVTRILWERFSQPPGIGIQYVGQLPFALQLPSTFPDISTHSTIRRPTGLVELHWRQRNNAKTNSIGVGQRVIDDY